MRLKLYSTSNNFSVGLGAFAFESRLLLVCLLKEPSVELCDLDTKIVI